MQIFILDRDVIANLSDGISVSGEHISGHCHAVRSKEPRICFFYLRKVKSLQRHFDFWIYDDRDSLDAFEPF